jgi:hypothetical protein
MLSGESQHRHTLLIESPEEGLFLTMSIAMFHEGKPTSCPNSGYQIDLRVHTVQGSQFVERSRLGTS